MVYSMTENWVKAVEYAIIRDLDRSKGFRYDKKNWSELHVNWVVIKITN